MADVVVVGGGLGGMAAALRLRAAGHDVVLAERDDRLGGKLASRAVDGFRWDTGPSLLTLPTVLDELLASVGTSLAELVHLDRLDPICRYRWPDGSGFDHRADLDDAVAEVEAMAPGEGVRFRRFLTRSRVVWETAERTFLAGPLESPLRLARRMRSPADLLAIDPLRTLHARAAATFGDPRLVEWAGRYATYSGSSPFRVPATLACIAWIEQAFGAWYVRGGLATVADALTKVLAEAGVEVRTGTEVVGIDADAERVQGVWLAGGDHLRADVVVAGVDAHHLYTELLPDDRARRRLRRAPRSTSGFALLLGVEQPPPAGLAHHTVLFSGDQRAEFDAIVERRRLAADPTVYVAAPPDPSLAPPGCESWFVLVNTPPADALDWSAEAGSYRDHLLEVLARRGLDLAGRLRVVEVVTPADIARRHRAWQGSIYGTSSDGRRAAFLRPANRGPRRGLYLVGGSTHPGGGLPLVATSAAIVAGMVAADGRDGRWGGAGR